MRSTPIGSRIWRAEMVHSVELLFDDETDAAMRRIWDGLTEAGVRSLASSTSPSNRPHVTMSVAEHMDDGVDDALRPLLSALPFSCTIGAPMVFGRGPFTLVRLLIPSSRLLALQADVHAACVPFMSPGPLPHAEPGHWTPHVTLARRVKAEKLGDALSLKPMSRDRTGTAVAIRHWDGNTRVEHPIAR
jgi:2'-5' RNA ligase